MKRPSFRARAALLGSVAWALFVSACGWDPTKPFERESPQVREAIVHLDGGDARAAAALLADYLTTGACEDGNIGTPDRVQKRPNGAFDLSLALFTIAEMFGQRFGEEEKGAPESDSNAKGLRAGQVECALRIVRAAAADPAGPPEFRARAHFLEGNLLFLNAAYEEAVRAYDKSLEIAPGMGDGGPLGAPDGGPPYAADPIGRDAAFNRAIALRRIEDKKDAGQDAASDSSDQDGSSGDGGGNQSPDGGGNQGDGGKDSGQDKSDDAGEDSGGEPPPKNDDKGNQGKDPTPPPQAPTPSRQSQDERILDQLENAPTVQQEAAKRDAKRRRVRGMEDK